MSFDVSLQRFDAGDCAPADAAVIERLLAPHMTKREASSALLRFSDGEADVYGLDDLATGFMVNHASGLEVWNLLVEVARGAELAILPIGCSTAVTSQHVLRQLPSELAGDAVIVATGAELLESISSS